VEDEVGNELAAGANVDSIKNAGFFGENEAPLRLSLAYTGGTFDLFHMGHVRLLQWCKALAKEVVVSLNTDEFIFEYKKKLPVIAYEERREVLLSCKYVDQVIPNIGGADSKVAITSVRPDVIVIGSDWASKNYHKQMGFSQDWLDEQGIGLCYVPYTKGISSSQIRKSL
jgi:glycerol-3-phosphate cytidylyltransferase